MSRGLGRIQRDCLRVIAKCQASGRQPTTFNIAAEVYRIKPDSDGNRMCNDAQHTAVKRALVSLRRKGLVSGQQQIHVQADGSKILAIVGADGRHAERCCLWSCGDAGGRA